jgi:hypothetical protein
LFRWLRLLESGEYATICEIANAEKINETYVGRVLRLTLLAPDIVEAILGRRQAPEMTLAVLMRPFPAHRPAQRSELLSELHSILRLQMCLVCSNERANVVRHVQQF